MNVRFKLSTIITSFFGLCLSIQACGVEPVLDSIEIESTAPDSNYQQAQHNTILDGNLDHLNADDIQALEWSRGLMSDYVESLNDGVDSFFMSAFFDDEIIEDGSSGSNGRVFFTTRRVDGEDVNYQAGINLRVVLPRTRDRFKLLIETDENEDGQTETDIIGTTENVTYSTALRVEVRDGRNWKSSFDNGVRWATEPIYFSRLRTRRTDYFDEWRTRVLHSIYWQSDVEWGSKLNMNALMPIDFTRHFNMGFNADYNFNDDMAELQADVSIFNELTHKSAMLYQLAAYGDTQQITKVNEFILSVSYRRKIYKSFVFAEIVPEIGFPRDLNYKSTPALNFTVEMIFGTD